MEEDGELECLLCGETFLYGLDHNCGIVDNVHLKTEPIPQEASDLKNSDDQLVRDNQTLTSSVHINESMDRAMFTNRVDHCGKDDDAHFMFQPISPEASDNSNDKYNRDNQPLTPSYQSNESMVGTVSPCCVDHNCEKDDNVQSKPQPISQAVSDVKEISHDQLNRDNQPLTSNVHINESMDEAILPYNINYNCGKDVCAKAHLISKPISQEATDNNGVQLNRNNQPLTSFTDSITRLPGVSSKESHKDFSGSSFGREYRDNYGPQEHFRVHTKEKPFGCKEFGARFCMRSNLSIHCPFVCEGCGTRFIHRSYLQHHLRLYKGIMPFVCRECGSEFSLLCGLNTHLLSCLNNSTSCDFSEKRFNLERNHLRQKMSQVVSKSTCVSLNDAYHFAGPSVINGELQLHPEVRDFSYPVRRKGISLRDNFISNY